MAIRIDADFFTLPYFTSTLRSEFSDDRVFCAHDSSAHDSEVNMSALSLRRIIVVSVLFLSSLVTQNAPAED
ncbi:MAG: hypothetical protein ACK58T_01030, partial [Phycisphaerae bacterium]